MRAEYMLSIFPRPLLATCSMTSLCECHCVQGLENVVSWVTAAVRPARSRNSVIVKTFRPRTVAGMARRKTGRKVLRLVGSLRVDGEHGGGRAEASPLKEASQGVFAIPLLGPFNSFP